MQLHKKVMVVDDNETDLYVSEFVMKKNFFAEVIVCMESAQDALDYLIACDKNNEDLPELIFLDINMPLMSGFDFLEEYDKLSENIKMHCIIMMLSTSLNEGDRQRAESNKYVCKFLNKPLTKDKIENFEKDIQK